MTVVVHVLAALFVLVALAIIHLQRKLIDEMHGLLDDLGAFDEDSA